MKILNLYAGIGGNRKLWGDEHDITAVEINSGISEIYNSNFPNDTVLITDAKLYLLNHYQEFDFIWASPPCQSHTVIKVNFANAKGARRRKPTMPDLSLYQMIIFLSGFFKGKYVVENVKPYYKPLIPAKEISRHLFWSNFNLGNYKIEKDNILRQNSTEVGINLGFDLSKFKGDYRKDQIVRNMVNPKLGKYILNCAMNIITEENVSQGDLFKSLNNKEKIIV
ncbi:MAG: DNA cytosine methyltransferase [Candidatus Anammoxibacter sp.]